MDSVKNENMYKHMRTKYLCTIIVYKQLHILIII